MYDIDNSGILLSRTALMCLTPEQRAAVLQAALGKEVLSVFGTDGAADPGHLKGSSELAASEAEENESFAELTPRMARKFVAGCGEKTKAAVEVMARSDSRFFQLADVAKAVGVSAPELRGVWGGLTRRTQTVTGDATAYLISWAGSQPVHDEDGNYIDQTGELTEMTYQSLRKVFGL